MRNVNSYSHAFVDAAFRRVTVLDAHSIASGSSGRSADRFDILLRVHSLRQLRHWESLGLNFNHIGYLRLARTSEQMELFARSVKMQEEAGFRSRLYRASELKQVVPHISPDGLEGGIFGPDDGFLDPYEMCTFRALAERLSRPDPAEFVKRSFAFQTTRDRCPLEIPPAWSLDKQF